MSEGAIVAIIVAGISAVASVTAAIIGTRNKRRIENATKEMDTGDDKPPVGELTAAIHEDVSALKNQQRRNFVALLRHLLFDHDERLPPRDLEAVIEDIARAEENAGNAVRREDERL